MKNLFCYELNEVPWRVMDYYLERNPTGELAALVKKSNQFTTHTVDTGELHPWSTWPTMHRGVSNEVHNIRYLNQDLSSAKKWPPVWQLLNNAGITTGVFGSLQSYPVDRNPNMLFHIPDTFAAGPETHPHRYSGFQKLNLKLTGTNSAVASKVGLADMRSALGVVTSGVTPITFLKVAKHLINEKRNPLYKSRRATLQPELALDVLVSCLKKYQPQYVSFFSNHVAGIMHRYWKYTFPEDFNYKLQNSTDKFHQQSLILAMDQVERHLKRLGPFLKQNNYDLVISSSMGQEAIDRGEYLAEIRVSDFTKFLSNLSRRYDTKINLAMHPDLAFEFQDPAEIEAFRSELLELTDTAKQPIFRTKYEPVGKTLNLRIAPTVRLVDDRRIIANGRERGIQECGLELFTRDIGTGYHQPNGMLLWPEQRTASKSRTTVDTREYASAILAHFNVDIPSHIIAKSQILRAMV